MEVCGAIDSNETSGGTLLIYSDFLFLFLFGNLKLELWKTKKGRAFRHGDIEDVLSEIAKKAGGFLGMGGKFGGLDIKRVYFGYVLFIPNSESPSSLCLPRCQFFESGVLIGGMGGCECLSKTKTEIGSEITVRLLILQDFRSFLFKLSSICVWPLGSWWVLRNLCDTPMMSACSQTFLFSMRCWSKAHGYATGEFEVTDRKSVV